MRERQLVIYKYFLSAMLVALAIGAASQIQRESKILPGSITTRWREEGDVVERCTSCHTAPHPGAPEIVAIHPTASYGCVACHGGTPSAGDLRAHDGLLSVKKNEGMLSDVAVREAGCGRCHTSEKKLVTREGKNLAPHLAHGRAIFSAQCEACHDPGVSHDRALPVKWMSTALTPTLALAALSSPDSAMPEFFEGDADAKEKARDVVGWLWSMGNQEGVRGYANVPGSSAEEGGELFRAYGCAACHVKGADDFPRKKSEDFVAYYIENPARMRHAKMPSFRLTRREAASVAKFVAGSGSSIDPSAEEAASLAWRDAKAKCVAANDLEISRAECGSKIAAKLGCGSCHSDAGPPSTAPDLSAWGATPPTLDRLRAATMSLAPPRHPHIQIEISDIPDLLVAMASRTSAHVVPKYDPAHAPYFETVLGDELLDDRGCLNCHSRTSRELLHIGNFDIFTKTPSLFGEGAKVQPEWLLAFFRDPEANGVRPWLHPEWVWGELVPQDKAAVRMPTYSLTNEETTAIVRALAKEDGGEFPYENPSPRALSSSDTTLALVHVNGEADNGGACMTCHYVGALPLDRAKKSLETVAPDLGRVSVRLRPKYVNDLLARPQDFVEGMPALWKDPAGPALAWTIPPDAEPKKTAAEQIALVSSFLYLLRDDTRLPRRGDELRTPILGLAHGVSP